MAGTKKKIKKKKKNMKGGMAGKGSSKTIKDAGPMPMAPGMGGIAD
jgi:hypothetical protein